MAPKFVTKLAPSEAPWDSGYASNGIVDPDEWATDLFGENIPGPWLTCYMIRRFGWPNTGSDDRKNLCSWLLETPIDGLYLCVTPYLGGGNIHFGVRFTKEVGAELHRDPGSKGKSPTPFQRRARKAIEAVLKDITRPVFVRDVGFSPFGRTDSSKNEAERFEGAGCTPEYWYSPLRALDEQKKAGAR